MLGDNEEAAKVTGGAISGIRLPADEQDLKSSEGTVSRKARDHCV